MTEDIPQHHTKLSLPTFSAAKFIKEIGRGKEGARSMSEADAQTLYHAMLAGQVSDLEMGGILLSMRIKGETVDEIAGFLAAGQEFCLDLQAPASSDYAPVVIPSYNGARKKANLTPLLACLLARESVPVLVHGVSDDPGRVTTAEIFSAMGVEHAHNAQEVTQHFARSQVAFMPIEKLSPAMHRILQMRRILGVRNSTHTLVKILPVFATPVLRLTSYTHPEYLEMLSAYFVKNTMQQAGHVFLMRATEGEAVASTGRAQQIDWAHHGEITPLVQVEAQLSAVNSQLPEENDAVSTAKWIQEVLDGKVAVPVNIAEQVAHCLRVAKLIKQGA